MSVYFVISPRDDLVKIGYSAMPLSRIHGFRLVSPTPRELITAWIDYSANHVCYEGIAHRLLKEYHHHGEWYQWSVLFRCLCSRCGVTVTPFEVYVLNFWEPPGPTKDDSYGTVELLFRCPACSHAWQSRAPIDAGPRRVMKQTQEASGLPFSWPQKIVERPLDVRYSR